MLKESPENQQTTEQTTEQTENPENTLSNSDLKAHPWVQSMAKELKALREEKNAREEDAKRKEEEEKLKRLEAEGRWEEAKKLHEQTVAELTQRHRHEILSRDLREALLTAGFFGDRFISGMATVYDPDVDGTPAEYAASLAKDENLKHLLKPERIVNNPPSPPIMRGGGEFTPDQIRALRKSANLEDRQKATTYLRDYFNKFGKFPDGL